MPDHVTLRIPKPRITLFGVLLTVIVGGGAYSMFWQKPKVVRPAVLPSLEVPAPSPAAALRTAACAGTAAVGGVSKTLRDAAKESVGQVTRKMNAVNACAGVAGSALAAPARARNRAAQRSGGP